MFPKVILIATASPCNAKCPHCPCTVKPEIRQTEEPYFKFKWFKSVVDEAVRFGSHIRLSGYGEPLMHPGLIELLEYGAYKGAKLSLITNGSLFTMKSIKQICKLGLECIEVSVDSHLPKVYSQIRIGLNFHDVKKNIIGLLKYRKNTKIMASIIDQPSRNPYIKDSEKYWKLFVDKVLVRKYVTWGILPTDDCENKPEKRTKCPYPWERLMLDPGGYFRLCPYDDQKLIKPFGHIEANTINEIFNSDRFNTIREGHEKKNFYNIELCNECTDWAYRSWTNNYRGVIKKLNLKKESHENN